MFKKKNIYIKKSYSGVGEVRCFFPNSKDKKATIVGYPPGSQVRFTLDKVENEGTVLVLSINADQHSLAIFQNDYEAYEALLESVNALNNCGWKSRVWWILAWFISLYVAFSYGVDVQRRMFELEVSNAKKTILQELNRSMASPQESARLPQREVTPSQQEPQQTQEQPSEPRPMSDFLKDNSK